MKDTRAHIRCSTYEKELIDYAAKLINETPSRFIMKNAINAAKEVIAEQRHFELSSEQWQAFCEALDAKPRRIPAMAKLLTERGRFDE